MSEHMPLTDVPKDSVFKVIEIRGGKRVSDRLTALGIRTGTEAVKISGKSNGPVVVKHGRNQTALGYGVSRKVVVEINK